MIEHPDGTRTLDLRDLSRGRAQRLYVRVEPALHVEAVVVLEISQDDGFGGLIPTRVAISTKDATAWADEMLGAVAEAMACRVSS